MKCGWGWQSRDGRGGGWSLTPGLGVCGDGVPAKTAFRTLFGSDMNFRMKLLKYCQTVESAIASAFGSVAAWSISARAVKSCFVRISSSGTSCTVNERIASAVHNFLNFSRPSRVRS